ncbi:MAG: GNAT family N-acetyltransferase [Thermoplasmata archaeon]
MGAARRHDRGGPHRATFRRARWPEDLDIVRRFFHDYRAWLTDHRDTVASSEPRVESGLALIDQLIAELPGAYGPPRGDILLWFEDQSVVACGALRQLEPKVGEIKRVYVRADYRGKEFGHPFVRALIDQARGLGYESLRADTLPTMQAAIEFYRELGFRPIPAFWPHPVANALFFEREIGDGAST